MLSLLSRTSQTRLEGAMMVKQASMQQAGEDCQVCLVLPLHMMEMVLQASYQLASFFVLYVHDRRRSEKSSYQFFLLSKTLFLSSNEVIVYKSGGYQANVCPSSGLTNGCSLLGKSDSCIPRVQGSHGSTTGAMLPQTR